MKVSTITTLLVESLPIVKEYLCQSCIGFGEVLLTTGKHTCLVCNGYGLVFHAQCVNCRGSAAVCQYNCNVCGGTGKPN